jgi:hypothetical protein
MTRTQKQRQQALANCNQALKAIAHVNAAFDLVTPDAEPLAEISR